MPSKPKPPQFLYVVLDNEQQLCGVFSTLPIAFTLFKQIITDNLTEDDIQALEEEYGEHYHSEVQSPASIIVCQLDHTIVWSYDSYLEISQAIRDGEKYEREDQ